MTLPFYGPRVAPWWPSLALGMLAVSVSATAAEAQGLDRSVRPPVQANAPFRFPHVETRTLANGLRVAIVEDHSLPVVAVRTYVEADSLFDPPGKEGLALLTLAMLSEGTLSKTTETLEDAQALLGTRVTTTRMASNAISVGGFTTITRNFAPALALIADLLSHPSFPAAALDGRKAELVTARRRVAQIPADVPRRLFYKLTFGAEHPILRSMTETSIASLTREDVVGFYNRYVTPDNATLVIVGDVRIDDVMRRIQQSFSDWKKGGAKTAVSLLPPPASKPTTIYLLDNPGAAQSYVYVGQVGPSRASPDYPALEALSAILGATNGSRLQQSLRDKHSYMYSGAPFVFLWRPAPIPSVEWGFTSIAPAKTDSALIEWLSELRAIRGVRPPTAKEMEFGRATRVESLPAKIETADSVASQLVEMARNHDSFESLQRYAARVNALTSADIVAAAAKYIDLDHLTIVVAGDRKSLEPALRAANIAPIVIVDANGKPVPD